MLRVAKIVLISLFFRAWRDEGVFMLKRVISTAATVALVLILGAKLGALRDEGVSLAAPTPAAIVAGGDER